jgi:anaerobic selenocysteine-containing dehydrogenase
VTTSGAADISARRITTQPLPGLEGGLPEFGRWHTRVRGAKEVLGQAPVSCMAEEIATPGDGQLKALITVAGNPVLSTPGGDKLDEVLPMLEAMISVDVWLNETTRHADVILPGLSPLEQPHHDDLILQFAIHSIANYSAPVFDPGDRPHEWEIVIRLTGLCAGTPAEDVDDGRHVTVKSEAGEIKVPVEITDAIKPGVVSMPHGWGHGKPGTRMSVANDSPGANTNALSPPTFVDEPSGNGVLNGIPVTVMEDQARFRVAEPSH